MFDSTLEGKWWENKRKTKRDLEVVFGWGFWRGGVVVERRDLSQIEVTVRDWGWTGRKAA